MVWRYDSSTPISWNLLHNIDHEEAFMNFTMWRTGQVSNDEKGQPINIGYAEYDRKLQKIEHLSRISSKRLRKFIQYFQGADGH